MKVFVALVGTVIVIAMIIAFTKSNGKSSTETNSTATPTIEVVPSITALPTSNPTSTPYPTYTPYPTLEPLPTYTPRAIPTSRPPIIIRETVVVTATASPTITPTPLPTVTPTVTPIPTATAKPLAKYEFSGTGNQILLPVSFDPNRLLSITFQTTNDGAFRLNIINANGQVIPVFEGPETSTSKTIFHVTNQTALTSYTLPSGGLSWMILADSQVQWKLTLEQKVPQRVNTPYDLKGIGSGYSDTLLLSSDQFYIRHDAFRSFIVELIAVTPNGCCVDHIAYGETDLGEGSISTRNYSDIGDYIIRIKTEPDVHWEITVP